MPRMAYSNTVARSNRLPSSRRWSGMTRKTSSSDAGMGQPPIRVVAYRFTHFRPRESQTPPQDHSRHRELHSPALIGHLAATNYFELNKAPINTAFIAQWKEFTKNDRAVTNDPIEATY